MDTNIFNITFSFIDLSTPSESSSDPTTQQNPDEAAEIVEGDDELDINGICDILKKMLAKAGITKSCEEILKMMADTDRYYM